MNYKKLEKRKGSDNMKCGNIECKYYLANSCTNSKVFLNPGSCRLEQLHFECIDCKKTKEERCFNCCKVFE